MNDEKLKYTEEHLWVHVEGSNACLGYKQLLES